jgi:hypothetical protein
MGVIQQGNFLKEVSLWFVKYMGDAIFKNEH